jgi:hypothetical protein
LSRQIEKIKRIKFPRISSLKPSNSIIVLIILTLSIFILGGGVYDIMEQPLAVLPTPGNPGYYPDITHQFLTESISFIFFLIIGISGGYISYRSTRYAYRPREAKMFLAIGVLMLFVAIVGSELALQTKI